MDPNRNRFYLGLDLGQRRDPSAVAVVEWAGESLLLRHVERAPLGTPYPKLVARIRRMVEHAELRGQCGLAVDATGVGAPVVEMLRAAHLDCEICAVTITGGERENQTAAGWNVPKRDLIAGVQVLLERGELRIAPQLREVGPLVRELMDMKEILRRGGTVRLGADGCGEHDDLVIALALACWRARKMGCMAAAAGVLAPTVFFRG
jgi:phage FluMu gp28-like protein